MPGATRKRQPDAQRQRDDAPDDKATDAKATDAKVARDDADARSTRAKDKDNRATKPPVPAAPKEPPIPPGNMPWRERWIFYETHRKDYPPHIRDMLDKSQNRTEQESKQIAQAFRAHHANQPMHDTSGGDWEKTNIAARTGVRPNLSATSTTKDGADVQFDDFDAARRVAKEYKASPEVAGKDPKVAERELQERMERHAQFAEDRGVVAYEWVAHSKDSYEKMTNALADLKGKAQKITNKEAREKLLERYKKISIVKEPILDK